MFRRVVVALVVGAFTAVTVSAAEPVAVKGSSATYPTAAAVAVGDKTVQLSLTGVGLRKRIVSVYAIGSYVQEGKAVGTADDVVKVDAVRLLHLVMERNVDPEDFIGAFRSAVSKSYPEDKFAAEFKQLTEAVGDKAAAKGDHVYLISLPDVGVRIRLADKVDVTIKNPAFARLWEVYLGENPIDDGLKKGLVGLLPSR